MLVLILTVCSVASPERCDDARLAFDITPMACMMQGQQIAADYLDQHPGHRIARWRCGYPERDEQGT